MTQEDVKRIFRYEPDSGNFIRKIAGANNSKPVGSIAGYTNSRGYRIINILGKNRRAHRVAFLYMEGYIPEQVDHINRDKSDNRWSNLRAADACLNMKNQPTVKENACNFRGVYKSRKRFRARIGDGGKMVSLGTFDTIQEAAAVRAKAEVELGYII